MITARTDRNLEGRVGHSLFREKADAGTPGVLSAALVVNTRSRLGRTIAATALDYLRLLGVPVAAAYNIENPARLTETVREALSDGHDLIVLGGGDGSVSSVVDLLAHTDATLGLLPLGTANDFARTLGIPFELEEACETVAFGVVDKVDLGLAGDNYYVNVASVGLATGVAEALSPQLKRAAGSLAYPMAALRAYAGHEPFSAGLNFPDGDHEPVVFDGLIQVAIGNGRFYGGGLVVAPGSRADDDALDVYAIEAGDLMGLGRIAWGLRTGEFVDDERVHHWRTRKVQLLTERRLPLNIDGELVTSTPKPFCVDPGALRVLVPAKPATTEDSVYSSLELASHA